MAQRIAAIPKITANTPQPPPNCSIMVMARKPLTAAPPSSTKGCTGMPPSPKKNREYTTPQETMEPRMALLESLIGKSPSSTICGTVSNPKNGVIKRAIPMIQDGMPKWLPTCEQKKFLKLSKLHTPENRKATVATIQPAMANMSMYNWILPAISTFCRLRAQ